MFRRSIRRRIYIPVHFVVGREVHDTALLLAVSICSIIFFSVDRIVSAAFVALKLLSRLLPVQINRLVYPLDYPAKIRVCLIDHRLPRRRLSPSKMRSAIFLGADSCWLRSRLLRDLRTTCVQGYQSPCNSPQVRGSAFGVPSSPLLAKKIVLPRSGPAPDCRAIAHAAAPTSATNNTSCAATFLPLRQV